MFGPNGPSPLLEDKTTARSFSTMMSETAKPGGAKNVCNDGRTRSSKSWRPRVDTGTRCGSDDGEDPVLVEDTQAFNDPAEEVIDKPLDNDPGIRHDAVPHVPLLTPQASRKRRLNGAKIFGSRMPGSAFMTSGTTAI